MRRRKKTPIEEAIAIADGLATDYPWGIDTDMLKRDDDFERLVALLGDSGQIDDEAFAELAVEGSQFLRAGAAAAIAGGREAPAAWIEAVEERFDRGEWGERQLLLRALARVEEDVIPYVLASAEEDWSGSPLAREVSRFFEARVEAGEELTVDDLEELDVRLQPLLRELIEGTDAATRAALRPALEAWQATTIDEEFFRRLGRIVDADEKPPATLVGSRIAALDAVSGALSSPRPRSVLLVGEPGVGKTTLIVEALRRLGEGWLAFQAGAAEVNAGQVYIGMLEARVQEIVDRLSRRRIVWVFPNFEEALWSGQHSQNPRGLLDAILPHIEAGDAIVVGEIDPRAYELVLQNRPRVARLFEIVRLDAAADEHAKEVARDWAAHHALDLDEETLAEAIDLANHYLPAAASPGNVLRVLELVRDRVARGVADGFSPESVIATLSDATGLPLHVLDPRAPLALERVRAFFESRVLGQPEAVECLVDRIALIKAGLTDPTRPLGVFLFVGPTGTGKTEIAKAFSAFVFGSEDRLARLDMSEYQTPESLDRLLGDATVPGQQAAPLIAQVRKQPFSVLLLDEFEKAHPQIWDIFLQVFDDGRLTDRNGRTVDLRHCVIVLTSNLGAAIPRGPGIGFVGTSGEFDASAVVRSVEQSFRPEFLNRLDRVVVFRPLGREIMRSLLEKELTDMLERRGFRMQPWAVEWDEAAVDFLIEQGFSADLGARPLKRAVEQHLLTKIAKAIVERQFPAGDQFLFITARDGAGLDVVFVDPDAEEPAPAAATAPAELTLAQVALDPAGTEAEAAFLREVLSAVADRVRTWQTAKEEALEEARNPAFWQSDQRQRVFGLIEYLDRLNAATATAERIAGRLAGRETHSRELVQLLARRLHVLAAALDGLDAREPSDARVTIRPGHADDSVARAAFVQDLAAMYAGWAETRGMRLRRHGGPEGIVLEIAGLGAYTLLRSESGLHALELPHAEDRGFDRVLAIVIVEASGTDGSRRPDGEPTIVRRYRHEPSPLVRDASGARTGRIDRVLAGDFDLFADAGGD